MKKEDFIEKYEFKIKFNNENIEYLNYVLEQLKNFDNKVVNCKIKKAVEKVDPTTQRITHFLSMDSDYWYFDSNNNSYQPKNGGWVYLDYHITMVSTSNFVENKRLKYDKIKELLTSKINYLNEKNSQFTSMLENLDLILHKLTKFNNEAKEIFSSIPFGVVDDIVDIKSLGEKWFIKITE